MESEWINKLALIGSAIFSILSVVLILAVMAAIFGFSSSAFKKLSTSEKNHFLRANGESAQATILDVRRTGISINDDPLVEIFLQIQPNGRPEYQAKTKTLVSVYKIFQVQVGSIIPVKIDPLNPQQVALDIDVN